MMKKLLKITKIATLLKSALFPNYQICRSQNLITQIEDLNKDTFGEISRQRVLRSGRAGSSF